MVYGTAEGKFTEDVREAALITADICEEYGLLNDMESGTFRRDNYLGIISFVAGAYLLSTEDNTRKELQCMSKNSQHASRIADATNTLANSLLNTVAQPIELDAAYTAILTGRKMNAHFTNSSGDCQPYSVEESKAKAEQFEEREADFEEHHDKIKAAVEAVYYGEKPRTLDDDEHSRQLCIPLWVGSS